MNRRIFLSASVSTIPLAMATCSQKNDGTLSVFVSILPMKYFVERIGSDRVTVNVMVGPGQNPATYDPLPHQMLELSHADMFFRIGVPFEDAWLGSIIDNNPGINVVDLRDGIDLLDMDTVTDIVADAGGENSENVHDHDGSPDPHIWLSPRLVKSQVKTICDALCELDPSATDIFLANLTAFQYDLDRLHDEITKVFEPLPTRRMMVFHPAWGYFAREFGLTQLPIEIEGKEPGPRELAQIIDTARREEIKVIFVQQQFASDTALAIAEAIGGVVVTVDPLAEDYLENLHAMARTISASLGGTSYGE